MTGKVVNDDIAGSGSYNYEAVIFDAYKCDTDNVIDDAITSYPLLHMESRRIFYSKIFNLMKSSYNYEAVIFDAYKCDTDNVIDDAITSYPLLQMESRRIFYSKIFNLMKSSYRY
jgi:hypothetical protein